MAGTIYIRQSSFADGDTITAALFNNEFNQLANAFSYTTTGTTGHTHDGTDGQGGHISKIGDQDFKNKIVADSTNNRWGIFVEVAGTSTEQLRVVDGAIVPVLDSDINLGSPTAYFKDSYIDTVTTTGAVAVGGALSAASFAIGGTALTATITELNTLDGITATTAELNYNDGVTSNIQTQLNAKQPLDAQLTDIASLTPTDGTFIVGNGTNFVAENPATALASLGVTSTATELNVLDGTTVTTTELNYVHNVTSPIQTQLNAKQALNAKLTDISNLTLADNFFLVSTGTNLALESPATALGSLGVTATATELNYVDGVTSSIQTQLGTKAPLASPTFTGTLTAPIINATSDLKIGGETIGATVTEINYLSGVTSSIQTQLNALQASDTDLSAIAALTPADGTFIVGNGTSWVAESGNTVIASLGVTATAAEINTLDGITATVTELNYTDGVTSNIQTQLDTKAPLTSPTFTGTVTADGLSLGDNDKATFGASNDLEIYHDGSNSYISDAGTGSLRILAQDFRVRTADNLGQIITGFDGGQVNLYYNSDLKLATTATGIDVTGTATMDGLTVDGDISLIGGSDLQSDGTLNIKADQDGSGAGVLRLTTNAKTRQQIDNNGDISFYEDTGATPKFFWDASAEAVLIGSDSGDAFNAASTLRLQNTNSTNYIQMKGTTTSTLGLLFGDTDDDFVGGLQYSHTDDELLITTNNITRMTINSSGNVGIGTISPTALLAINSATNGAYAQRIGVDDPGAGTISSVKIGFDVKTIGNHPEPAAYIGVEEASVSSVQGSLTFATRQVNNNTIAPTEAMRINAAGNVGIGTTSPVNALDVSGAIRVADTAQQLRLVNSATTARFDIGFEGTAGNDALVFDRAGVGERMRIDASGNVGIGTDSPSSVLTAVTSSNANNIQIRRNSTTTNDYAQLGFSVSTGTTADNNAEIRAIRTNSPNAGDTAIAFLNRGSGSGPTERMRIDSSGNVGIGEAPNSNSKLQILDTAATANNYTVHMRSYQPTIVWNDISGASTDFAIQVDTSAMIFQYGDAGTGTQLASEAMRITSGGTVLIGTTSAGIGDAGIELRADGQITGTRDNNIVGLFNRLTSDGEIINLRKDGTTVGSIGTISGYLTIGSGDTGLLFDNVADKSIRPWNLTSNTSSDADTDLGLVNQRFKDLHLSGTAYIDGRVAVTGPQVITTNTTAVSGDFLVAGAGGITITLPASPSVGDYVIIKDGTGAAATTSFTVARNGSNIASDTTDLTFNINFDQITMTYINATIGWSV